MVAITPDAELGLLGALAGAVIGGMIAWFAGIKAAKKVAELQVIRERQIEEEEASTVKAMLDVEIELNLQMLGEAEAWLERQPTDYSGIQWLAVNTCPRWSTVIWEHSILLVHRALPADRIMAVQKLYNSLRLLTATWETAVSIVARKEDYAALVSVTRCRELMRNLLQVGNPLKDIH
jgi:hypothetical protein